MKLKNIKLIQLLLIVGISSFSCKKYLDEKSDTSLTVPATLIDFQGLLDNSQIMNRFTPSSGNASSDDYFWLYSTYNSRPDVNKKLYTWIPYDYNYANDWGNSYNGIYYSNICLEGIEKIDRNTSNQNEWYNIKGSALFYRAYSFLNLLMIYAKAYDESSNTTDLGIALKLVADPNSKTVRSSVKQCYDQVVQDTKEAIHFLPNLPQDVLRPSKAAAYGLLGRAYLFMREYDKALLYSDSSLQINNYLMDYNGDNGILNINSTIPFSNYRDIGEITFYSQANNINAIYAGSLGRVDSALYGSYAAKDLRKAAFFKPFPPAPPTNTTYYQFKGSYASNLNLFFTGIATDEMYLIRAECYARLGQKNAALTCLNTLMKKRWKNDGSWTDITATDANDALNKVLEERRKELITRGLRWMDVKRLNKEGRNIILTRKLPDGSIITLQPNANYYALPLPTDIINVTGIVQNLYP